MANFKLVLAAMQATWRMDSNRLWGTCVVQFKTQADHADVTCHFPEQHTKLTCCTAAVPGCRCALPWLHI